MKKISPHGKDTVLKIEENKFPERKLRGLSPNFYIHISGERFLLYPPSVCLFGCSRIGGPILGIYKELIQMNEYGNWEQGRAV
jgi:hypothetical protein